MEPVQSPVTPPWSLIIPKLEERARVEGKKEAARILLRSWERCARMELTQRPGATCTRSMGRHIGEGMRALIGGTAAGAEVQRAWDSVPLPLSFEGRRHCLWRSYMYIKGVALHGYVDQPPLPEDATVVDGWLRYRNRRFSTITWAAECLIEGGRAGVYGHDGQLGATVVVTEVLAALALALALAGGASSAVPPENLAVCPVVAVQLLTQPGLAHSPGADSGVPFKLASHTSDGATRCSLATESHILGAAASSLATEDVSRLGHYLGPRKKFWGGSEFFSMMIVQMVSMGYAARCRGISRKWGIRHSPVSKANRAWFHRGHKGSPPTYKGHYAMRSVCWRPTHSRAYVISHSKKYKKTHGKKLSKKQLVSKAKAMPVEKLRKKLRSGKRV